MFFGPEFEFASFGREPLAFGLAECRRTFSIKSFRRNTVLIHWEAQGPRRTGPERLRRAATQEGAAGAHIVPENARILVFVLQHVTKPQTLAQLDPDPTIRAGLARWFNQLIVPDNATLLRRTANAPLLNPARHWQDVVRVLVRFVFEKTYMDV